jgi:hypothetical protein
MRDRQGGRRSVSAKEEGWVERRRRGEEGTDFGEPNSLLVRHPGGDLGSVSSLVLVEVVHPPRSEDDKFNSEEGGGDGEANEVSGGRGNGNALSEVGSKGRRWAKIGERKTYLGASEAWKVWEPIICPTQ